MAVTLGSLVAVRSQRAQGLEAYLKAFAELRLSGSILFGRSPASSDADLDRLYQWPSVIAGRPGESTRKTLWFGGKELPDWQSSGGWFDKRLIVVTGEAGAGKTALTWMTARAIAKKALEQFDGRTVQLDRLRVPIRIGFDETYKPGTVDAAIKLSVEKYVRESSHAFSLNPNVAADSVADLILSAIHGGGATLIIDAPEDVINQAAWQALLSDVTNIRSQTLIAGGSSRGQSTPNSISLFQLAPLEDDQRMNLAMRWVSLHGKGDPEEYVARSTANDATRRITNLPFHFWNFCAQMDTAPSTVDQLDEHGDITLFEPAIRSSLGIDEPAVAIRLLSYAAATLFETRFPAFSDSDWDRALQKACDKCGVAQSDRRDWVELFRKSGLLVGNSRFAHTDFFYFLAAVGFVEEMKVGCPVGPVPQDSERFDRLKSFETRYRRLTNAPNDLFGPRWLRRAMWSAAAGAVGVFLVWAWLVFNGPTLPPILAGAELPGMEPLPILPAGSNGSSGLVRGGSMTPPHLSVDSFPDGRQWGSSGDFSILGSISNPSSSADSYCVAVYAWVRDKWYLQRQRVPDVPEDGVVSEVVCKVVNDDWKWSVRTRGGSRYKVVLFPTAGPPIDGDIEASMKNALGEVESS